MLIPRILTPFAPTQRQDGRRGPVKPSTQRAGSQTSSVAKPGSAVTLAGKQQRLLEAALAAEDASLTALRRRHALAHAERHIERQRQSLEDVEHQIQALQAGGETDLVNKRELELWQDHADQLYAEIGKSRARLAWLTAHYGVASKRAPKGSTD